MRAVTWKMEQTGPQTRGSASGRELSKVILCLWEQCRGFRLGMSWFVECRVDCCDGNEECSNQKIEVEATWDTRTDVRGPRNFIPPAVHTMDLPGEAANPEDFMQCIQPFEKISPVGDMWIFTDGSVKEGRGTWAIIIEEQIPYSGPCLQKPTVTGWGHYGRRHTTSFSVELTGLVEAIQVISKIKTNSLVVLQSDSSSAIQAILGLIDSPDERALVTHAREQWDKLLRTHRCTLKWIKGHSFHKGNTWADALAEHAMGGPNYWRIPEWEGKQVYIPEVAGAEECLDIQWNKVIEQHHKQRTKTRQ